MTVQEEAGGVVGVSPWIVGFSLVHRLCGYLMSQRSIGQKEKTDMRMYVDHILLTDGEGDEDEEGSE